MLKAFGYIERVDNFFSENTFLHNTCATSYELLSYISTMEQNKVSDFGKKFAGFESFYSLKPRFLKKPNPNRRIRYKIGYQTGIDLLSDAKRR